MRNIGIIWDLDGTIVDTADFYQAVFDDVFEKYGYPPLNMTHEQYRHDYFGQGCEVLIRDHVGRPLTPEEEAVMKQDYLFFAEARLQKDGRELIHPVPGVERILTELYEAGYPMAVASASWLPTIVHCLEAIGHLSDFVNIASGFLLPSKPAPDVFQLAAGLLNIPPERCVVFEDSLMGMKGARNAGMKCVGIATSVRTDQMVDADIRLAAYADLDVSAIEKLFS